MSEVEVIIPKKAFLPAYHHLLNSEADINFLWGGRDSGKSHFIAQKLIHDCLALPYFRCLLIKKTDNSIKESQWQTIKDVVDQWDLSHLFHFRTSPLSIECVNGNRFIARGCEDPQKLKSIKDPSHAWYEEGNQLDLSDFITVTTTLRSNRTKIQQWFSFNPECEGDYEEYWLYKTFFQGKGLTFNSEWALELPDGEKIAYQYTSTHTTYHENKWCRPERKIFLEQLAQISPYYYQVYTLGKWGRRENDSPFAYAFSREKHLAPTKYNPQYELIASFDFNKNPICSGVYQIINGVLYGIKCFKLPNSDIYQLCDVMNERYPNALWIVTGDATGRNTSALVQDNINYYKIIKQKLRLSDGQIKVPTINPPVKENQVLVNAVLSQVNCKFDPVECRPLIFDFENVKVLPDGSIEKADRNNPTQQADSLDHFRYLCNRFFKHILKI